MPDHVNATKRKKQMAMIAFLVVGLIVAIVTPPKTKSSTDQAPEETLMANPTVETDLVSGDSASGKPVSAADEQTEDDEPIADSERFAIRELSRIEWNEMRRMTLFRPRPTEAALAGTQTGVQPIRVEAIYGATYIETSHDASSPSEIRSKGETRTGASTRRDVSVHPLQRRSALIGRAIVRPGEALPDGRTILDVTTEGIAVAP